MQKLIVNEYENWRAMQKIIIKGLKWIKNEKNKNNIKCYVLLKTDYKIN